MRRTRGRRRGHPDRGDDLRHAERQGGGVRGERVPGGRGHRHPAVHLGHARGPERADAVGPDGRGLLRVDPARQAHVRGAELRPGRVGDGAVPEAPVGLRGVLRARVLERGPAERDGRLRRHAGGHGARERGVREERVGEHDGRVLRLDAAAHQGDLRGLQGLCAAAAADAGPAAHVAVGAGGLQDRPGHVQQLRPALRERGRAVQHRGVAQVQAPDHGGQVPGADGHRQGPGRGRRARRGH